MIGDIDTLVASVDSDWQYVKRSFCVLELYAAVPFGCNLVVGNMGLHKYDMFMVYSTLYDMLSVRRYEWPLAKTLDSFTFISH